jgi:hypothetical protein
VTVSVCSDRLAQEVGADPASAGASACAAGRAATAARPVAISRLRSDIEDSSWDRRDDRPNEIAERRA